MENLHDWINSLVLLVLGIAFLIQNNIMKYMKTAMEAINPEKIKQAQEFIEMGREHHFNLQLSSKITEINKEAIQRYQEMNKDFIDQYNELIGISFGIMKDKDWQFRKQYLQNIPKNTIILTTLLESYDRGEFPVQEHKIK